MPPTLRIDLQPLRAETLASITDLVTRTIREAILKGKLAPGARLQQDRLAEELQVSRQPVREALRRLQAEGLVVQLPQRWMAVQTYSPHALRENYRLRSVLEAEAARAAAQAIRPVELGRLKEITRAIKHAAFDGKGSSKIIHLNHQFHRLIWGLAGMPTLLRFIEQLWVGRTIFTPLFIPGRARRSVIEHEKVIDALERHDPTAAGQSMHAHITRAAEEYFSKHEGPDGPTKTQSQRPAGQSKRRAAAAKDPHILSPKAHHPC